MSKSVMLAVFVIASLALTVPGNAGGWGKGPRFGGWHPLSQPIPAKPLDGAKRAAGDAQKTIGKAGTDARVAVGKAGTDVRVAVGKAGTDVWKAITRPFVETAKFLQDPLAGPRDAAGGWFNWFKKWLIDFAWRVVEWLTIGFGGALAFCIALAMGFAALLVRGQKRQQPGRA